MSSRIKGIAFMLLVSALVSCTEQEIKIPAGIIPRDSMIVILADVHIAESRLIQDGFKPNNQSFKSEYFKSVLNKAGVDSLRFNQSFLFYSSQPDHFQVMYEEVITEISKRQAQVKSTPVNAATIDSTKVQ